MALATELSLLIAIVQAEDASRLTERLVERGFGVTRIATRGGFLQRGNAAIVVGAPRARVPAFKAAVEETCRQRTVLYCAPMNDGLVLSQPLEVEVGGAVIFELPVERQIPLVGRLRRDAAVSAMTAR